MSSAEQVEVRRSLADKLQAELDRVATYGPLKYCTHMTLVIPPSEVMTAIAALRSPPQGGDQGAEAMRKAAEQTALRVGAELGEPAVGYRIANAILAMPVPAAQPHIQSEGAGDV